MATFILRGQAEVKRNGDAMAEEINSKMYGVLSSAAEILKKKAIQNVRDLNKGYVNQSVQGLKITEDSSWITSPLSWNELTLTCKSEHAAIVEFGAPGRTIYSDITTGRRGRSHKGWPILRQQGIGFEIYRREVKLQEPKHFLGNAMISEKDAILSRMKEGLNEIIKGAGI